MTPAFRYCFGSLILLAIVGTACSSAGDEGKTLLGEPATVLAEFDGSLGGLSPDGELIFLRRPSVTDPDQWFPCLVEIAGGAERFCIDERPGQVALQRWSADSSHVAFTRVSPFDGGPQSSEILVVAVDTGSVAVIADEQAKLDRPSFSPSGDRVVYRRQVSGEEPWFDLYDLERGEAVATVPDAPGGFTFSPHMIDESTAVFGIKDELVTINFDTGEVEVALDHTDLFEPSGYKKTEQVLFDQPLLPGYQLDDARLVVIDPNMNIAMNVTGGIEGFTSGSYLADLDEGTLEPLLQKGPEQGGWIGPFSTHAAGGSQIVISWLNTPTESPRDNELRFSLLDLAVEELPVVPSDLPLLWTPEPASLLSSGVSSVFTMAVPGEGSTTQLLQLATD